MKWNKLLLVVTCTLIVSLSGTAQSQPQPPVLSVVVTGTWINLSWTPNSGRRLYPVFCTDSLYGHRVYRNRGYGDANQPVGLSLGRGRLLCRDPVARRLRIELGIPNVLVVIINPSPLSGNFQVFAFNDLGMHCYDPDFSVFSILPLFNVLHAQTVQKGTVPQIIGPTVKVTYQAKADGAGWINTTSIGKTNFWDYVLALFGENPPVDEGLLGAKMPGLVNQPQPFSWAAGTINWFSAAGIPITAVDDSYKINSYPLMNVQALDPANAAILSSLPVVVPVSNEMACNVCHDTGNNAAKLPGVNWSQNSNLAIQFRENILILHDYRNGTNLNNSRPVLCASCHYSPALDLGRPGRWGLKL